MTGIVEIILIVILLVGVVFNILLERMIKKLITDDWDASTYTHALGYRIALGDMKDELRRLLRYGDLDERTYATVEAIRDKLFESCADHHLPGD